ncbi:MAG: hypothetical protein AB9869_00300 [Verrucomicrobiia bacterium]
MDDPDVSLEQPTTAPPNRVRESVFRFVLIAGLHLALFEAILQFSVHWRESTGELWSMALYAFTFVALAWAISPTLARFRLRFLRRILAAVAAVPLFLGLFAGDYVYSWHLRPNFGLYEEPAWVQQHPPFQRELRQRIAANLWHGAKE